MPIYEFHCKSCDSVNEELVRSPRDEKNIVCQSCGGTDLERALSAFAARSGAARSESLPVPRGCGRCGDPNGPCGLE